MTTAPALPDRLDKALPPVIPDHRGDALPRLRPFQSAYRGAQVCKDIPRPAGLADHLRSQISPSRSHRCGHPGSLIRKKHAWTAARPRQSLQVWKPVLPGDILIAEAKELHNGRSTGLYHITITNQHKKEIAFFKGNCFRTGKKLINGE